MEWLVESVKEVFDVPLENPGLAHVDFSNVVLDNIGVRAAELSGTSA